jgi:hypothetical protein
MQYIPGLLSPPASEGLTTRLSILMLLKKGEILVEISEN